MVEQAVSIEELLTGHQKPDAFSGKDAEERKKALTLFLEKGLPGRKDEEYKFTHFDKHLSRQFDAANALYYPTSLSREEVTAHF
jgi:hypothetical protein